MVALSQGFAGPDGAIDPTAVDPPSLVLVPFSFWLSRAAGAASPPDPRDPAARTSPQSGPPSPPHPADLRSAIRSHLDNLGWPAAEPLRWAITAVDPLRGLQLEGVGVIQADASHRSTDE